MKKFIATAAIMAATSLSGPASAQTVPLNTMLAQIALQCGATATMATCDSLIGDYLADIALTVPADQRAALISQVVVQAVRTLKDSAGTDQSVSTEIAQIVGSATSSLEDSGSSESVVNSAVSNVVVAVLEVVEQRDLQDNDGTASAVASSLNEIAAASTDTAQKDAVEAIANVVETGGNVQDAINEVGVVNSYASPA